MVSGTTYETGQLRSAPDRLEQVLFSSGYQRRVMPESFGELFEREVNGSLQVVHETSAGRRYYCVSASRARDLDRLLYTSATAGETTLAVGLLGLFGTMTVMSIAGAYSHLTADAPVSDGVAQYCGMAAVGACAMVLIGAAVRAYQSSRERRAVRAIDAIASWGNQALLDALAPPFREQTR